MPKVKVNDIEMYYEVHGEGESLILLHTFATSGTIWTPFIQTLKEHFKLIIPDMRGHGQSTNPSKEFIHQQVALDIYALLDELRIDQFKAMGFSLGAGILVHMATQQPERIKSMVLISATSYFPKEAREQQVHALDKEADEDWSIFNVFHQGGENQVQQLRHYWYEMKDSYDDYNFTPPYLSTIKAITLIVNGDRDEFFPVDIPISMYQSIPNSYLWIMPNMGHSVAFPATEYLIETTCDFLIGKWEAS